MRLPAHDGPGKLGWGPPGTLRRLCDWVVLDFIPDLLESWQQEQHHPGVGGLMQGIQGNSSEAEPPPPRGGTPRSLPSAGVKSSPS